MVFISIYANLARFYSGFFVQLSPCTGLMGRIFATLVQWAQDKTASVKVVVTPTMPLVYQQSFGISWCALTVYCVYLSGTTLSLSLSLSLSGRICKDVLSCGTPIENA